MAQFVNSVLQAPEKYADETRTRSRSDPGTEQFVSHHADYYLQPSGASNGSADWTYGPYQGNAFNHTIEDVYHPKFQTRINKGHIVNSPVNKIKTDVDVINGHYEAVSSEGHSHHFFDGPLIEHFSGIPALSASEIEQDIPDYITAVKQEVIANVDPSEFALGEDVGELLFGLKNLRKHANNFNRLGDNFVKFVNKYEAKGLSRAEALAKAWVNYRFVVSPLVRSIWDSSVGLAADPIPRPPRLTARAFRVIQDNHTDKPNVGPAYFDCTDSYSDDLQVRASILYTGFNPIRDWQQRLGLRSKDIPVTAWNLIPLSFMVDRVVDVSQSIRGLTNLLSPSLIFLASSYVIKHDRSVIRTAVVSNVDEHDRSGEFGSYTIRQSRYIRVPYNPSLRDVIPAWHPAELVDSASKIVDLLSIGLLKFIR
jgi:hypothetical protein